MTAVQGKARRTIPKQRPRLLPFVILELPRLTRCNHTQHPVPCVLAKLLQCLDAIDDIVLLRNLAYRVSVVTLGETAC
jgi:hypothetical protein